MITFKTLLLKGFIYSLIIWGSINITSTHNIQAQIINKFGIKGGAILNDLASYDDDQSYTGFYKNYTNKTSLLSYDIGIFAEFFAKPRFCISGELHYNVKGEENKSGVKILAPDKNNPSIYKYQGISDRFSYLSLQILPQWRFELNSSDKLYFFGGPKFDYRIGNSNSDGSDEVLIPNSKVEFGVAAGIGNLMWELFYLELKYEYSFTNVYAIEYGDEKFGRNNQTFLLLMGVSLKKLFKIDL